MSARGRGEPSGPGGRRRPITPLHADRLVATLLVHQTEFIVVGGFAVAAHGHPRGTKDIDICPAPDAANLRRLATALEELEAEALDLEEFAGEFDLKPDFESLSRGGNWRLTTRFGQLDVMQSLTGLSEGYADLEAKAEERDFLGHRVRFCGYEDLLEMKAATGRGQDLIDIQNLRAARGEL